MKLPASSAAARNVAPTVTVYETEMSDLGAENPLPPLAGAPRQPYRIGPGVPADLRKRAEYGYPPNLFPYSVLDGYTRTRSPRRLPAVILENSLLRATVLPSLGGRIWELVDKATGKNLVHTPPTIQFANFALRNAWFAGGIEWNIGTRGHSPTSCAPWHAAIVETDSGPVLRLWEFERLREVVVQVDLWLPEESPALFAAVRLRNPNAQEVPMYWWTNAAVPEGPQTRVIAPAVTAFGSDYESDIRRVAPADLDGVDATWPVRNPHAADYFFDVPAAETHPWITAVDQDGDGLAMLSTDRLRGQKLFVWGQGDGGRNWQEWLSPGFAPYLEIQAGLAQTQFEHLPMPAGAEWVWVEAFGNARLDPGPSHSGWTAAVEHARDRVSGLVPPDELDHALDFARQNADAAPARSIADGSGWGALEGARRAADGLPWVEESGTPFPRAGITAAQGPWLALLEGEPFSAGDSVPAFVAGRAWEERLAQEGSPRALFHAATMAHARGDLEAAAALYRSALDGDPGLALARRGLGLTEISRGAAGPGLEELRAACALDPRSVPLAVEAMALHLEHGQPEAALALAARLREALGGLDGDGPGMGRVLFLMARAHARLGDTETARAMLLDGIRIADLREGDESQADLWREVFPDREVPPEYRFAMH